MKKKKTNKEKGEPKFFHQTVYINGKQTYVPYEWKKGEKEEYENICLMTEEWGGIPMDVNWAKSTVSYKEAELKFKNK